MSYRAMYVCFGVVFGLISLRIWRQKKWGKCRSKRSMENKTVIITGASSGIGKATAMELAKRGARVILACRDMKKAEQAIEDIRCSTSKGELKILPLDLASLRSVREFVGLFCTSEDKLDVLINNAAVFQCPYLITADNYEMQFGVNHLGHFFLTSLLLDKLKQSAPSRVVIVTSSLYEKGEIMFDNLNSELHYDKHKAYCNSKLANVLFSQELCRRLEGSSVNVYAVSPGMVWTNLGRHVKSSWLKMFLLLPFALLFIRTPFQGCQTVLHCAVSEDVEIETGKLYRNCSPVEINKMGKDVPLSKKLWDTCENFCRCFEES